MAQKILIFKIGFFLFLLLSSFNLYANTIKGKAKIIDGDTIHIGINKIRLHGIDAPEINQSCIYNDEEWQCGKESRLSLKELINNQIVVCESKSVDKYKRFIAICFANRMNLNKMMVKQGWAIAYKYYSLDYVNEENIARSKKIGIWKGIFEEPYKFRSKKK
jgi:endonuclease YncB( thermonuclease family)